MNVQIPADAEAVGAVTDSIGETLIGLDVPEQKRLEICLAVQEALANSVTHGCGNDPSKVITCQMQCDRYGRIIIVITDPGPGFNPESVAHPTSNLHACNGRGVFLIRQLMDEVQFARAGSEIRMWKY